MRVRRLVRGDPPLTEPPRPKNWVCIQITSIPTVQKSRTPCPGVDFGGNIMVGSHRRSSISQVKNEWSDPDAGRNEPVVVGEVKHAIKQLTPVAVVDDPLIHQEPVLPRVLERPVISAPQPLPAWQWRYRRGHL